MQPLYYVKLSSWSEKANYRYAIVAPTSEAAGELAKECCLAADAKVEHVRFLGHTNSDSSQELP